MLVQVPEKWLPVFGRDMRNQNNPPTHPEVFPIGMLFEGSVRTGKGK